MNTCFSCYYEQHALLKQIANNQTRFWVYVQLLADWDHQRKQMVARITASDKRAIMGEISPLSRSPLNLASQYISKLSKLKALVVLGGGEYALNPGYMSGGAKYISKELRQKNSVMYEKIAYHADGKIEVEEDYIITEDGERIDL